MALKDEVKMAISSHSVWKNRLRKAIDTGTIDITPEDMKRDDLCVFGKWLLSDGITQDVRATEEYKSVKNLHAEFHGIASEIVRLALAGNKEEANRFMEADGKYTFISARLVLALSNWIKVL